MASYRELSLIIILSYAVFLEVSCHLMEGELNHGDEVNENNGALETQHAYVGGNRKTTRIGRDVDNVTSEPDSIGRHQCTGECLCSPGITGPHGPPGQQGIPGRDGRDGRDQYGQSPDQDTTNDKTVVSNSTGGAVFVRWGRSECPSFSDLVYSGIAGGGYYSHKGSGSNYLCMPEEPIYDEPQAGTSGQSRASLYGAEYETNNYTPWIHLHNNNVPCAVCWAPSRPSLLMVPARNVCPGADWTTEYSGYLVAAYYNHEGRTQFVCMDKTPTVVPRSSYNSNGNLFFIVEGRCGTNGSGLPCGPYVDGYELTCAVCTR